MHPVQVAASVGETAQVVTHELLVHADFGGISAAHVVEEVHGRADEQSTRAEHVHRGGREHLGGSTAADLEYARDEDTTDGVAELLRPHSEVVALSLTAKVATDHRAQIGQLRAKVAKRVVVDCADCKAETQRGDLRAEEPTDQRDAGDRATSGVEEAEHAGVLAQGESTEAVLGVATVLALLEGVADDSTEEGRTGLGPAGRAEAHPTLVLLLGDHAVATVAVAEVHEALAVLAADTLHLLDSARDRLGGATGTRSGLLAAHRLATTGGLLAQLLAAGVGSLGDQTVLAVAVPVVPHTPVLPTLRPQLADSTSLLGSSALRLALGGVCLGLQLASGAHESPTVRVLLQKGLVPRPQLGHGVALSLHGAKVLVPDGARVVLHVGVLPCRLGTRARSTLEYLLHGLTACGSISTPLLQRLLAASRSERGCQLRLVLRVLGVRLRTPIGLAARLHLLDPSLGDAKLSGKHCVLVPVVTSGRATLVAPTGVRDEQGTAEWDVHGSDSSGRQLLTRANHCARGRRGFESTPSAIS